MLVHMYPYIKDMPNVEKKTIYIHNVESSQGITMHYLPI